MACPVPSRRQFVPPGAATVLVLLVFLLPASIGSGEPAGPSGQGLEPVYHVPLRIHLGGSGRGPDAFMPILDEINHIWLSQAGICFEMEVVLNDEPIDRGMDLWFLPVLSGGEGMNGYYRGDHDIQVRDTPVLRSVVKPARHPAARTAAHELGHGLSLSHRQDSDDNLMRSKTYGWRLNEQEIAQARRAAADKAFPPSASGSCGEPVMRTGSTGQDDTAGEPRRTADDEGT